MKLFLKKSDKIILYLFLPFFYTTLLWLNFRKMARHSNNPDPIANELVWKLNRKI